MVKINMKSSGEGGLPEYEIKKAVERSVTGLGFKPDRVLLIPPDFTRMHSGTGKITAMYYELLKDTCKVDILPALGTHEAMTEEEIRGMFGYGIPLDSFIYHNWKNDVVSIGRVPADFVSEVSEGLVNEPMDVEINKRIAGGEYDLVVSLGQVVPHEVIGMANYTKNILVGCGGSAIINKSHMLGAVYGMERIMGKDHSPVRKVFDYAEENFLGDIPLMYVLTVTTCQNSEILMHGLFIGRDRALFEEAVRLSRQKNLTFLESPLDKVVVYLDPGEFKSTWLGNKAVYRTRMAISDGGELLVLAPGVRKFGEDTENDRLIRKYGYVGRVKVLELTKQNEDLKNNLSVAAHLMHGSSDGRFTITYAAKLLTPGELEGVNFRHMPFEQAISGYNPEKLCEGFNTMEDGERIYYISNPALGLWADRSRF